VAVLSDGRICRTPEDVVYSVGYVGQALIDAGRPLSEVLDAMGAEIKRLRASMQGSQALRAVRAPVIDRDEDNIPAQRHSPLNY
jgi:hypothetical protein